MTHPRDHRDTPIRRMCVSFYYLTGCLVGVTSHTTPLPAGEGLGEGPLSCVLEMCAKNLRELCEFCERKNSMICASSPIGVTSHITPLSNRRGVGGEASVFSVCRRPSVGSKCAPKRSVRSVSSVRERNILRERRNSPRKFSNILFLTDNTEEQNTQHSTETLSQPISQNLTANVS